MSSSTPAPACACSPSDSAPCGTATSGRTVPSSATRSGCAASSGRASLSNATGCCASGSGSGSGSCLPFTQHSQQVYFRRLAYRHFLMLLMTKTVTVRQSAIDFVRSIELTGAAAAPTWQNAPPPLPVCAASAPHRRPSLVPPPSTPAPPPAVSQHDGAVRPHKEGKEGRHAREQAGRQASRQASRQAGRGVLVPSYISQEVAVGCSRASVRL